MEGSEHLRLFCALRLPENILDTVSAWQRRHLSEEGRVVPRQNLHITLAFLGRLPAVELLGVAAALRAAAAVASPIALQLRGYGLRTTRRVAMLTFEDRSGAATEFAGDLFERLEGLGVYGREKRPWLPHLTVLRFTRRPQLDPPLPGLGRFGPSEAAVYHSVLRSTGAQYEVLESIALGG